MVGERRPRSQGAEGDLNERECRQVRSRRRRCRHGRESRGRGRRVQRFWPARPHDEHVPRRRAAVGNVGRPERRPGQHAGRHRVDDHVGQRGVAARGVVVQAGGNGGARRVRQRVIRRGARRGRRDGLHPGPGRERLRGQPGDGEARLGVPGEHPGEVRAGARRGGGGRRRGLRGHVDGGVRAQRRHREGGVERHQPAQQRAGIVRDPARGGRRAGVPGERLRVRAWRRHPARARRGDRQGTVVVQHGDRRPAVRREVARPRVRRRLGDAARRDGRVGDVRGR